MQSKLTRRAMLAGVPVVAAAAAMPAMAAPAPTAGEDAELVALECCRVETLRAWEDVPEDTAERSSLWDRYTALEKRIITTPAHGPAGLAVKLRLARDFDDERAVKSALADVERLGGAA
jgi:hypothetical protein